MTLVTGPHRSREGWRAVPLCEPPEYHVRVGVQTRVTTTHCSKRLPALQLALLDSHKRHTSNSSKDKGTHAHAHTHSVPQTPLIAQSSPHSFYVHRDHAMTSLAPRSVVPGVSCRIRGNTTIRAQNMRSTSHNTKLWLLLTAPFENAAKGIRWCKR